MELCNHPVGERKWEENLLVCGVCDEVIQRKETEELNKPVNAGMSKTICPALCIGGKVFQSDVPGTDKPVEGEIKDVVDGKLVVEWQYPDALPSLDQMEMTAFCHDDCSGVGFVGCTYPEKTDASASIPKTPETVNAGPANCKTFHRKLPVSLSQEELSEHGEEMARLINLWTESKLDLKAYQKSMKKLIDDYEERYINIAGIVKAGSEERDVQCYAEIDVNHGVKRVYRCDTHELVEETTLEKDDLQAELDFTGEQSVANVEKAFGQQEGTPFEEEP